MEMKVRAVGETDSKSVQEVEKELLEKHEEKFSAVDSPETNTIETKKVEIETKTETPVVENPLEETKQQEKEIITPSSELSEEEVLKFIGNRYGKEIKSLDDFNQAREETEPLPEDVS